MGGCQNYGPFLGHHTFDNHPHRFRVTPFRLSIASDVHLGTQPPTQLEVPLNSGFPKIMGTFLGLRFRVYTFLGVFIIRIIVFLGYPCLGKLPTESGNIGLKRPAPVPLNFAGKESPTAHRLATVE